MAGKPVNITIGATIASSLGAAVRDAKNQLGTLGAKVSSLNDKKVKVDQLVAMKAQTNDLGRAYGQTRKRADELSAAYAAMGPPTAAQTREMRAAEQAAEKAGAALTKQREALRELRASLHSAGVDTRNLGTESVRLGSQLDTLKRRTSFDINILRIFKLFFVYTKISHNIIHRNRFFIAIIFNALISFNQKIIILFNLR